MDGLAGVLGAVIQAGPAGEDRGDTQASGPSPRSERSLEDASVQSKPAAATVTQTAAQRIRVLLADDHPLVRQGLAGLLRLEPDIELIGEALDGQMAVQMVRDLRPDVVVMDVSMPQINGIAATHHIMAETPSVRIIVLSCYTQEEMALALREAGAAAYLTKDAPVEDLLAAIRGQEPPPPRRPK